MNKEIILNCMPPFTIGSPSAALSILKAYLCKHGYKVKVIYWNILLYNLENEFTWNKCQNVQGGSTLIYAAYLAVKTKNNSLYNEVKAALQTILPVMLNEKDFFDEHIEKYATELDHFIDNYLESIDFENILYFGFSVKLDQWVLASVFAEKIKKIDVKMPVVIGGINIDEIARVFLENFMQFDIAIWGEGEMPLLELTHILSNTKDFSKLNIERSYYRSNNKVKESLVKEYHFLDLSANEIYPDYKDYFKYRKQLNIQAPPIILIEGSRGCHWNKCQFCYLNSGYKYRQKSVEKIVREIKYMIFTYSTFDFEFLDNDIIGKDIYRFHFLLDEFVKIKNEYYKFKIIGAEIITLDLSYSTIKRMAKAGISNIQIGLESFGNSLLKKIAKKNTFASNLNTTKHCIEVDICLGGANVLYNLLEETEEDIFESIENLRFFRFILDEKGLFTPRLFPVSINSSSRYYKTISENKQDYMPKINLYHKAFFYTFDEDTQWHLFEFELNHKDAKWDYFTDMLYHYTNNTYEYKFIHEDGKIIYQEFLNKELTEHIDFDNNEPYISILDYCYDKPVSIHELYNLLTENDKNCCEIDDLKEKIDILFYQGLLYRTPGYTEIVSIVNVKK